MCFRSTHKYSSGQGCWNRGHTCSRNTTTIRKSTSQANFTTKAVAVTALPKRPCGVCAYRVTFNRAPAIACYKRLVGSSILRILHFEPRESCKIGLTGRTTSWDFAVASCLAIHAGRATCTRPTRNCVLWAGCSLERPALHYGSGSQDLRKPCCRCNMAKCYQAQDNWHNRHHD